MAVTTQYSDLGLIQNGTSVPSEDYFADDYMGPLRIAQFTHDQSGAGDATSRVWAVKLPPGRVTLLGFLCRVYHNWTTASATMDVGWGAYTAPSGSAVAASYDGLDDGLDVDTAGQIAIGSALATAGQVKTFESQDGVWITFESKTTAIADGDDLTGYLVYVCG